MAVAKELRTTGKGHPIHSITGIFRPMIDDDTFVAGVATAFKAGTLASKTNAGQADVRDASPAVPLGFSTLTSAGVALGPPTAIVSTPAATSCSVAYVEDAGGDTVLFSVFDADRVCVLQDTTDAATPYVVSGLTTGDTYTAYLCTVTSDGRVSRPSAELTLSPA